MITEKAAALRKENTRSHRQKAGGQVDAPSQFLSVADH